MIHLVDYNAGNVTSVRRALTSLALDSRLTADPDELLTASRIIFPGVGHAATAMAVLRERGLDEALVAAYKKGIPILGICVGSQVLLSKSEEGNCDGLDIIPGQVKRFSFDDPTLKIPHMGWNSVDFVRPHPLFAGIKSGSDFYFVHSYYTVPESDSAVWATCNYGIDFACAVGHGNLFATQFHCEKSGEAGLRILKNFATWDGTAC